MRYEILNFESYHCWQPRLWHFVGQNLRRQFLLFDLLIYIILSDLKLTNIKIKQKLKFDN